MFVGYARSPAAFLKLLNRCDLHPWSVVLYCFSCALCDPCVHHVLRVLQHGRWQGAERERRRVNVGKLQLECIVVTSVVEWEGRALAC